MKIIMNKIEQYNKLIEKIVFDYVKRLYKEENIWEEPEERDFRLMDYMWVNGHMLELWGRFIDLNDLLICEANNFPAISLIDWTDYELERHEKGEERITNYYFYVKSWIWKAK